MPTIINMSLTILNIGKRKYVHYPRFLVFPFPTGRKIKAHMKKLIVPVNEKAAF